MRQGSRVQAVRSFFRIPFAIFTVGNCKQEPNLFHTQNALSTASIFSPSCTNGWHFC